jgi:hypothetical protein
MSGCEYVVASALVNHFGFRMVTIAGTLLSVTGFVLSMFAPSLPVLYLTFGVMGGACVRTQTHRLSDMQVSVLA